MDFDDLDYGILFVGALFLVLGVVSAVLRRTIVPIPLTALVVGLTARPLIPGMVQAGMPPLPLMEEAARLTLSIGLMGTALRLPRRDLLTRRRSVAVLIFVVMPLMWGTGGLIVWSLGLSVLTAFLVGANSASALVRTPSKMAPTRTKNRINASMLTPCTKEGGTPSGARFFSRAPLLDSRVYVLRVHLASRFLDGRICRFLG